MDDNQQEQNQKGAFCLEHAIKACVLAYEMHRLGHTEHALRAIANAMTFLKTGRSIIKPSALVCDGEPWKN